MGATGEVTAFRGALPPTTLPQPAMPTAPDAVIAHALAPLYETVAAALAQGDRLTALRLAYAALTPVAEALAARREMPLCAGQLRAHALLVELDPLPLAARPDGTLAEQGTAVAVFYRNCTLPQEQAEQWAQRLGELLGGLSPDPWVILAPAVAGMYRTKMGVGL
jgi:hypothetical protein